MVAGLSRAALVACVVGAALASVPTRAGATVTAGGFSESGLSSCGNPPGVPGQTSATAASWNTSYSGPGCSLLGQASATPGHLSASATIIMDTGDGASGTHHVRAGASFSESLMGFEVVGIANLLELRLHAQISVSGTASASSEQGSAGVVSQVSYSYNWNGARGDGIRLATANSVSSSQSETGEWGVIDLFINLTPVEILVDELVFGTQFMSMTAQSDVQLGKGFVPGEVATGLGTADFSHTLVWQGLVGIQGFDAAGNEINLPDGFVVPLIGSESGFDYARSAAVADAPEPATLALLGLGLGLLGLGFRRRA